MSRGRVRRRWDEIQRVHATDVAVMVWGTSEFRSIGLVILFAAVICRVASDSGWVF